MLVHNGRMPFLDTDDGRELPDASVDLDPFESLVADAIDELPPAFLERLGSVAIVVEDEPSAAQLAEMHVPGLFGLYTGVPPTSYASDSAPIPSKITIFRGPHLRAYPNRDTLASGVAATVRHEIAHHFGISDARLHELAREHARRGPRRDA